MKQILTTLALAIGATMAVAQQQGVSKTEILIGTL